MSRRMEKVADLLQTEIAELLARRVKHPAIERAMVSITHVDVAPDLSNARIHVSVMADAEEQQGYGAIRALSPDTGEKEWEFKMTGVSESGLLVTGGDVLFSGSMEGYFIALDSFTGEQLWMTNLGGRIAASPMSFEADGKQMVAIASGNSMFVFGLRD